MNVRGVGRVLGLLMVATSAAMVIPLLVSLIYGDGEWEVFGSSMVGGLILGGGLAILLRGSRELGLKDGFLIVTFGWVVVAFIGCLPFWISGSIPDFTDAYFESMSGFTTTGASILTDIEAQAKSLLMWRSLIQWLGGMGIVVLSLAILPILGVGGMQLFKAEAPGPTPDRITPRIKETAKLLWGVYLIISGAEVIALLLCGLNLYDAVCHTFTTMATGGFSTQNSSIAGLNNSAVEWVLIVFMIVAGVNFTLHFAALHGRARRYWRDNEFRVYVTVIFIASAIVLVSNFRHADMAPLQNLRSSVFQVVSIITTTGFVTEDYERWSSLSQFILLSLMFVGACAGSTGGGMKNVRLLLLIRHAYDELRKLLHPRAVYAIRYNEIAVSPDILTNILGFFLLLILVTVTATFAMTLVGLDLLSAFGSVAATLNNIGPGIGSVGPADNFAHVPGMGKWVLIFCMLLGRLELYTVLVLFTPDFWRRV